VSTQVEIPDAIAAEPRGPRLDGKVAIVTGGGSRGPGIGTGRAAAILFALHGAKVLVVDLDEDAAGATVEVIRAHGGTAEAFAADLTSESDCAALARDATARWGPSTSWTTTSASRARARSCRPPPRTGTGCSRSTCARSSTPAGR